MEIMDKTLSINKNRLYTALVLYFVGLGWLSLILALLGFFYSSIILIYLIIGALFLIYFFWKNKEKLRFSRNFFATFIISVLATLIFSIYTTPTIFSGRDQGSLSQGAIRLAQNHKIFFSSSASKEFFNIYGIGRALNFPGFSYTKTGELTTQFPLGYISWLASFYSFFGLQGLVLANAVSFILFLLSFFLLAKLFLKPSSALMLVLLALTSFIFSWFLKFTLSENLGLFLIWFGIYEFILYFKANQKLFLYSSIASLGLMFFVRIESLAFFLIAVLILIFKQKKGKSLSNLFSNKKLILILASVLGIFIWNLLVSDVFLVTIVKGFINSFSSTETLSRDFFAYFLDIFYVLKIFFVYSLLAYLVLGLWACLYLFKQKKFQFLIPLLIVLPSFIYLIHPSISEDNPWMLRRFLFSIVPALMLYSVILLERLITKKYHLYFAFLLLLALNLSASVPYIFFSENKNMLGQIEEISKNFRSSDLILVDKDATGDGWAIMAGPLSFLYGKQAVYFFNPSDLTKINAKNFDSIYFIIPDNKLDFYGNSGIAERLRLTKKYRIETSRLSTEENTNFINLPKKEDVVINGGIYILNQN